MTSKRSNEWLSALFFLVVSGCVGNTLEVADDDAAPSDAAPKNSPPATTQPPVGPFTSAQVQAALATCDAAHGSVVPLATTDVVAALIVGSWLACSTSRPVEPFFQSGSFDADDHWSALLSNADGGLNEGHGLLDEAMYSVFRYDDSGTSCDEGACGVDLRGEGTGETQLGVAFEKSPTRMLLGGSWFVRIGH